MMRYGPFLAMLVLLLGAAPAPAQDSPGIIPMPKDTAAKPAKKHIRHKATAVKPAEAKAPAAAKKAGRADSKKTKAKVAAVAPALPQPRPAEAKAVVPKPAEAKPAEAKAPEAKIPEAKPAKTAAVTPAAPKPEAAKAAPSSDALAGIPPAERQKIQAALSWSGDFAASTGGDEPMLAAIKNFQKRHKAKITGVLTTSERADLVAAAKAHEAEYGWSVVVDPATGVRIGLPTKLVPHVRDAAHGTRWSSAHGEVQVETFRYKQPDLTLAALFEREKKEPATRRIESSALHDDGFFIGGMQGLKMFAVRAKLRDGEIRGYIVLYDQMMETIVEPVTAAMAAAFSPFPDRSAPFAALAKPVEYGNGLVVSAQGHIVTDLRLTQGCQVIVASGLGNADRVAADEAHGLALLRVYGAHNAAPLALTQDAPKSGDLTLVGIPDPREQGGSRKLTEVKARLADGAAIELRQPAPMAGFSGAAALDAQGHVLGMMEMGHAVLASVEAAAPPVRLVSAAAIRAFLAAHDVAPAAAPTADAKSAVVRIICVRK
jgi:hypothetical protein